MICIGGFLKLKFSLWFQIFPRTLLDSFFARVPVPNTCKIVALCFSNVPYASFKNRILFQPTLLYRNSNVQYKTALKCRSVIIFPLSVVGVDTSVSNASAIAVQKGRTIDFFEFVCETQCHYRRPYGLMKNVATRHFSRSFCSRNNLPNRG